MFLFGLMKFDEGFMEGPLSHAESADYSPEEPTHFEASWALVSHSAESLTTQRGFELQRRLSVPLC